MFPCIVVTENFSIKDLKCEEEVAINSESFVRIKMVKIYYFFVHYHLKFSIHD